MPTDNSQLLDISRSNEASQTSPGRRLSTNLISMACT